MTNEALERQLIGLIAADRIYRPISSMSGKLERLRPKLADAIEIPRGTSFTGTRVHARVEVEDRMKARSMSAAVQKYCDDFNKEGKVLTQYIEDERAVSETYLHFGTNPGCRLTQDDYMSVMRSLKFTDAEASALYPQLMAISRKMAKEREETERSILVG